MISDSNRLKYRPEIDGLRAISVLAVILFHTGLACPGGYVGVDIFFVISGYLITNLIVKELKQKEFSIGGFWLRRARRILPAVFTMTAASLALGYWLLTPYHLMQMAKSALAQSFFASNFFFWRDRNYFNQESEWKLLIHTWSLSVEEQFYIIFPFVLILIFRWQRRYFFVACCIGGAISLAVSCLTIHDSPAANFYLLPFRTWELLAGALLVAETRFRCTGKIAELIAVTGIVLIVFSIFYYDNHTVFPGWAAVVPVFGSMLLIMSNQHALTGVGKILALAPLVWVGKLSFSLYLWHWPLLSISRFAVNGELSNMAMMAVMLVTAILSCLSYYLIEHPIRRRKLLVSTSALLSTLATTWLLITLSAVYFYWAEGCPQRSPYIINVPDDVYPLANIEDLRNGKLPILGDRSQPRHSFIVWGDSHAAMNMPMIDELAKRFSISGLGAAMSSSPPLPGTQNGWNKDLREWNTGVVQTIEEEDIQHIFLMARWSSYIEPLTTEDLHFGTSPDQTFVYVDSTAQKNPSTALQAFKQSLQNLCTRLTQQGRHVYLVPQVPEQRFSARLQAFIADRTWDWIPSRKTGIDRDTHDTRQLRVEQVFESLKSSLVTVIPSDQFLFNEDNSTILSSGDRWIYSDSHHLSIEGSRFAIEPLLEPIIASISDEFKN